MSYRTRSVRRVARKTKRNLVVTLFIISFLLYATLNWILPTLIGGIGFITGFLKHPIKQESISENPTLAPPVFNIPYEATNSSPIDIKGYATANSKVELFLDDSLKDTIEVSKDGSFVFKNVELFLGINNIYGKTIDEKDKESLPSKTIRLIFDSEKPRLEISEPEDGKAVTGDRKVKISGQTDTDSEIYINGTRIIVSSDGKFSSDQSLNDGDNYFTIKAQDKALNYVEIARRINFQP